MWEKGSPVLIFAGQVQGGSSQPSVPQGSVSVGVSLVFHTKCSSSVNNAFPASLQRGRAAGLVLAQGL